MNPGERIALGSTGVMVSRLGMGTGPLGKTHDEASWSRTFGAAWDAGIRLFDTSPFYGFGNSEKQLGRQISRHDRSEFALATKVGRLLRKDGPIEPFAEQYFYPSGMPDNVLRTVYDYSRAGAAQSFEESLARLGLDRVDILYVHDIIELSSGIDHVQEVLDEALPVLAELKSQQRVSAIGIGVQVNQLLVDVASNFPIDVCLLAGRYTLLDQSSLDEALPICAEKGIRIVVGSPYNTGILHDPKPDSTFDFTQASPELIDRALRLKAVCARHGVRLPAAALQFPFGHPSIAAVLTGAETAEELTENVALMQVEIPEALWHELQTEGLIHPLAPLPCGH